MIELQVSGYSNLNVFSVALFNQQIAISPFCFLKFVSGIEGISPNRNLMPPPELAADAPVLDVAHPMIVNLRPALRMEAHLVGERARPGRSGGRLVRRTLPRGDTRKFRISPARRPVREGADGCARG